MPKITVELDDKVELTKDGFIYVFEVTDLNHDGSVKLRHRKTKVADDGYYGPG